MKIISSILIQFLYWILVFQHWTKNLDLDQTQTQTQTDHVFLDNILDGKSVLTTIPSESINSSQQ